MEKKKSNIFVNTLVLVVVTLVCVALLAVVNQVTKGPIEQAEVNARAQTYRVVYADAPNFAEVDDSKELIENSPSLLASAGYDGCSINDALSVTDESGNVLGYVVAATSPNGYGGDVQVAIGITKDGVLTGFQPITHSETPGFGARCEDDEFKSQFAGMSVSETADGIDGISGATITSNAVREAVGSAVVFYQENLIK